MFNVGDKVRVYVDRVNGYCVMPGSAPGIITYDALCLENDGLNALLGWTELDNKPSNSGKLNPPITNFPDHIYGGWIACDYVSPITYIEITTTNGCNCKKCNNYNNYAEPNQSDGSFICYTCRN